MRNEDDFKMNTSIVESKVGFSLAPQNIKELLEFAEILSKSTLVPKEFINNAGNIVVAIQWGLELGLQAMQSMQSIAVINGRPSLWGDAVLALVKSSPACEYVIEEVTDTTATCKVKRKGELEQVRYFTVDDAKKAGLWGKQGPWTQYPKRMLQMRARSWALRDVFTDVLRGMPVAEEVRDIPNEQDITSQGETLTPVPAPMVYLSDDAFNAGIVKFRSKIASGEKSADELIKWQNSKHPQVKLTDEQVAEIESWVKPAPATIENEAVQADEFLADYENGDK